MIKIKALFKQVRSSAVLSQNRMDANSLFKLYGDRTGTASLSNCTKIVTTAVGKTGKTSLRANRTQYASNPC